MQMASHYNAMSPDYLPYHFYSFIIGEFTTTSSWSSILSLGEMQRVSFARLLLAKRKHALLDEGLQM